MASASENDYWPGFVDALVNMLLNLLFIVGVMAMAVGVLGLQIAKNPEEAAMLMAGIRPAGILAPDGPVAAGSPHTTAKPASSLAAEQISTAPAPSADASAGPPPATAALVTAAPASHAAATTELATTAPAAMSPDAAPAPRLLDASAPAAAATAAAASAAAASAAAASAAAASAAAASAAAAPVAKPPAPDGRGSGRGAREIRIALGTDITRDHASGSASVGPGKVSDPALSVLRVEFKGDAMDVSDQYRALLTAYVRREKIGPEKPLALWVTVGPAAPLERRAAYLRLAVVRNVLLDAGLPPAALSTRILPGPSRPAAQTVFVGLKSSTPL